jgi:2-C-methyl-D-erythritol 4-phosphate cytidylyltransferase
MIEDTHMASAIIVAAGKGSRMKGPTRKQYLELSGRPVLSYSLITFDACTLIEEIFLVVPKNDIDACRNKIISALDLKKKVHLISGGVHRQDSVYNGLLSVGKQPDIVSDIVVIHDGVRPFVRPEDLTACIRCTKKVDACILGTPASDTLKRVDKSQRIEKTLDRKNIWLTQTPQAFKYDLIMEAHEAARRDRVIGTDDASLVERLGKDVKIIDGNRYNIKITVKEDLAVAHALIDAALV